MAEVNDNDWKPCVKKPVVVEYREQRPGEKHISTREGITPIEEDDLIMRGVEGEEYPIGRELFEKTYAVDEESIRAAQRLNIAVEDFHTVEQNALDRLIEGEEGDFFDSMDASELNSSVVSVEAALLDYIRSNEAIAEDLELEADLIVKRIRELDNKGAAKDTFKSKSIARLHVAGHVDGESIEQGMDNLFKVVDVLTGSYRDSVEETIRRIAKRSLNHWRKNKAVRPLVGFAHQRAKAKVSSIAISEAGDLIKRALGRLPDEVELPGGKALAKGVKVDLKDVFIYGLIGSKYAREDWIFANSKKPNPDTEILPVPSLETLKKLSGEIKKLANLISERSGKFKMSEEEIAMLVNQIANAEGVEIEESGFFGKAPAKMIRYDVTKEQSIVLGIADKSIKYSIRTMRALVKYCDDALKVYEKS